MRVALFGLFALILTLTLSPEKASAEGDPERVAIGSDLVIGKDEVVQGDVSVTNGNLTVVGEVRGKAVVVNGNAGILGTVEGDVTVTNGNVEMGEDSAVNGNVVATGDINLYGDCSVGGNATSLVGEVFVSREATVGGAVMNMAAPDEASSSSEQPAPPQRSSLSNALGRFGNLFGWSLISLASLLLAGAIASVMPKRVRVAGATLEAEAGPSVIVGAITALLLFPVTSIVSFVLVITVIGVVLIPVLAGAVALALLFGLVVVSLWLGKRLYDSTQLGTYAIPPVLIQVLMGMAVILISTLIPAALLPGWAGSLMMMLLYVAACFGLGAALLSRFGTLAPPKRGPRHAATPRQEEAGPALTAPLGPMPPLPKE